MQDIITTPNIEHYPQIIEAAKTGRLVIFVGAGVSALLGLPLWNEFANKRLDFIYKKGYINFRTKNELAKLRDSKKVLSICDNIIKDKTKSGHLHSKDMKDYYAQGMFEIPESSKERYEKIYGNLYSTNAIFVTTNYDNCLDLQVNKAVNKISELSDVSDMLIKNVVSENEIFYVDSDFLSSKLVNGNVLHIHGSVKDEPNMLVTLTDYLGTYSQKNGTTNLVNLLDRLFNSDYVVLFIGYGLEEMEILEFMLSKINDPDKLRNHYMLYKAYREDKKIADHMNSYFSKFSTELIPYDITENGYDQLIDIIENWSKYLSNVSKNRDFTRMMRIIDLELEKSKVEPDFAIESVCDLLKEDKSLEVYLFKRLAEDDFQITWFNKLDNEGFFSPTNIPDLYSVEGGYRVYPWFSINYLIRLSRIYPDNKNIVDRLIRIINDISKYVDAKGHKIENYHVHRGLVSIIGNIDNRFVSEDLIRSIGLWKYERIRNNLLTTQLRKEVVEKFMNSESGDDHKKLGWITVMLLHYFADSDLSTDDDYFFKAVFDEKLIQNIASKCSDVVINEIEKILKLKLAKTNHNSKFNYNDKQYLLKLSEDNEHLKVSIIQTKDIIGHVVDDNISDDVVFEYDVEKNFDIEKYVQNVLTEITKDFEREKLPSDINDNLRYSLLGLFGEGTYRSLYERKRYNIHGYEGYLGILMKIIDEIDTEKAQKLFERYSQENLFIYQKIILYGIGSKHQKCISVFWKMLKSDKGKIVFGDSAFGDELRVVLEQIDKLEDNQYDLLHMLINDGPLIKHEMDDADRYIDIWKLKRLNALLNIQGFRTLRDDIKSKYNSDFNPTLSAAVGPVQVGTFTTKSPISIDKMMEMTVFEISEFIRGFVEKDGWNGPSVEGLGNVLKNYVENNPEIVVLNLRLFAKQGYPYITEILNGLDNVWKNGGSFDWDKLLSFIYEYINDDEFWKDSYKANSSHHQATYTRVLYSISRLIESGCRNDKTSYETTNYETSKSIILEILNRLPLDNEANYNDGYMSYAHSTMRGEYIDTLIILSLYGKRNNITDGKWDSHLENKFIELLTLHAPEAFAYMGLYSVNIEYLNENLLYEQIRSLKEYTMDWEAFFEGFVNGNLGKRLFVLMKDNYYKGFHYSFKYEEMASLIARHFYIAVVNFFDEANDLVFNQLIDEWNVDIISKLQWEFFREIPDDDIEKETKPVIEKYIKSFGDKVINIPELNSEEKSLLSASVRFLGYVDPFEKWFYDFFKNAMAYVEVEYNSHAVIESIHKYSKDELSENNKKILADLFDVMTDYVLPSYPDDKISEIIECFFKWNIDEVKDKAANICNKYHAGNIYLLKNLCDKYMK
jgi:hypothetical protein